MSLNLTLMGLWSQIVTIQGGGGGGGGGGGVFVVISSVLLHCKDRTLGK